MLDCDIGQSSVSRPADSWFQTVFDVLQTDDEACWGLIRAVGGRASGVVALVAGDASPMDALASARTLCELGLVTEARDVLAEVVRVALTFVAGARREGPWRALGGTVPGEGCSVDFAGRWTDDNEIPELTGSETAMLVALGYQQAPEDDEAQTGPTPQGPAPCR